jgi:hypothetical protein
MRRHHPRIPWVIVALVFAAGFLIWLCLPRSISPYNRETYILVSDPVIVLSWGREDNVLTIISLPADIAADGTHGYGTYSLAAFWRLGEIDKKDGTVLAESVSEALGIPVTGYIGPKTGTFFFQADALTVAKHTFSFANIIRVMSGLYRTNIQANKFMSLAWLLHMSRPYRVDTYDFTGNPSAIAQDIQLPDGSLQRMLDPERIDAQLASVFEDDAVRQESVTAAVYNTTDMPSLGNRVGRLLTNLGVSVVTVGNDTPEVGVCTLTGSAVALKSKSAAVIITVLGCKSVVGQTSRADLILRVGSSYAKRFLPN